jgi:competence protein ComFC
MPGDLAYQFVHLIWVGLDWMYPPDCGGCGKSGSRWCNSCQMGSKLVGTHCCQICSDISVSTDLCKRCQEERPAFTQVRSWAVFEGPVRNAVHRLKYKGDIGLGETLAAPLIADLRRISWPVDLVIPVPLSLARLAERGYNQAALIARSIAHGLRVPYNSNGLKKVLDTPSQVGMSFDDRRTNVVGAFVAVEKYVASKRILVVDDVTTTGSTLNECAKALKVAGAQVVYGYTFARASYSHGTADVDVGTI